MFWKNKYIKGKEVVLKIKSHDIENDAIFYTDSNGLDMVKRVYNLKPEYEPSLNGNMITANYYPVNSAIYVQDFDQEERMTILNDRSQGATCKEKGEIEIMLHRRILVDDSKGVGEIHDDEGLIIFLPEHNFMLENAYSSGKGQAKLPVQVRTTHWLLFSNTSRNSLLLVIKFIKSIEKNIHSTQRAIQYRIDNPLLVLYAASKTMKFKLENKYDQII